MPRQPSSPDSEAHNCPHVVNKSTLGGRDTASGTPKTRGTLCFDCAVKIGINPPQEPYRSSASKFRSLPANLANADRTEEGCYPGYLHKGYRVIYRPSDPNRPFPDVDSDCDDETYEQAEREAKLMSEVIPLSGDEGVSAESSFSSKYSADSQASRDSDKDIREKGFDVVKTRDLSPRTKQRRRESKEEHRALNKGIDDLHKQFKPTCSK
ncbi:hypothetical protein V8F20_010521 [Naviculisporaceae sp. PSN 640]